jgi:hypothetical protein
LPVPGYNFARPCGGDRAAIDEASAQPFTSAFTAGAATLSAALHDPTGKTVLLWGTGNDGIYTGVTQATALGVTTLTITGATKVSNLPTDFYHPFCRLGGDSSANHFTNGFVGIVRFPNAPALCGRQQFAFTDNSSVTPGTIAVVFQQPQTNLRAGDALDFWDATMAALPTNCAVATRTDDTHFIVTVAFASMTNGLYATSHGAAAWYWNDASQKFNYRWGEWDTSNRTVTPTVTFNGCNPSCQQFNPCFPQVVAFTPNSDVDPGWESHWFGTFNADGIYGSRNQLNIEFEIPDLLWQTPLKPADIVAIPSTTFHIVEDDGTCKGDSYTVDGSGNTTWTLYYPPHPRVEARCASPDGTGGTGAGPTRSESAPAFTADALGNTASWPAMVQPPNPGTINETYAVALEPGTRYANELASGSGCRWAAYYYALTLGGGN